MTLQKQQVPQTFVGGIDTRTDSKAVRHPNMLQMDNVVLESPAKVVKRYGHTQTASVAGEPQAVLTHKDSLLVATDQELSTLTEGSLVEVGVSQAIKVEAARATEDGASFFASTKTLLTPYRITAWWDGTYLRYTVRNTETNAALKQGEIVTSYTHGTPVKISLLSNTNVTFDTDVVHLIVDCVGGLDHKIYTIPGEFFTSNGTQTLWAIQYLQDTNRTNPEAYTDWGVVQTSVLGFYLKGFSRCIDDTTMTVWTVSSTTIASEYQYPLTAVEAGWTGEDWGRHHINTNPTLNLNPGGGDPYSWLPLTFDAGTGGSAYYLPFWYASPAAASGAKLNVDGINPVVVKDGPSETDFSSGAQIIYYDSSVGAVMRATYQTETVVDTLEVLHYGLEIASHLLIVGTSRYLLLKKTSNYQATYYLMEVESGELVAQALYSLAGTSPDTLLRQEDIRLDVGTEHADQVGNTTWTQRYDTSSITITVPYKARVDTTLALNNETVQVYYQEAGCLLTFTFDHDHRYSHTELGTNLHIAGGFVQNYDGQGLYEHGFFTYPEGVTATDTGAGALAAGTYAYKVVYEWVDSTGQVHRSSASPAITCVTGANRQNTVTYPNYRFGLRTLTDVVIGIYRTQVGGSSVYYRVTTVSASPANAPSSATSTYVDNIPDATIATHDTLYTVGGELDNDVPPPCNLLISAKNRLWAVDEWGDLWFSKEYRTGEAPGFSLVLKKSIPQYGGAITALAQLDDKMIVFKKDRIYAFSGDGPTPDGVNDTFSMVGELPARVGTTEPNSVINYPGGVIFKSNKGFYLLDRSLNVIYIGAGPDAYNDLTICSAIHHPTLEQVRFYTTDGATLVFSYAGQSGDANGAWSTFSNLECVDATVVGDSIYLLKENGALWLEDSATYEDHTTPIQATIETPWFTPGGPQNWKRVYRALLLGEKKSDHTLKVGISYNYVDADQQVVAFDTTALADTSYGEGIYGSGTYGATGEGDLFQFRINPARQECSAIKLRIWDEDQSGTGESFSLTDLTYEVGMKNQATKLGSGRSG